MAFAASGLNPGAANSKGGAYISVYVSADAVATQEGANYFDSAADYLNNDSGYGMLLSIDTATPAVTIYGYTSTATAVTLDTSKKENIE
jgi:hypothetical protein